MVGAKCAQQELHWREVVNRQAGSGLSVRQYCAKAGISEPSFYAWRKRFRKRDEDGRRAGTSTRRREEPGHGREFIPLTLRDSTSALVVIHPLGYQVRVTGNVNLTALRQVLEVLDGRRDG
jgi:hypothetical protein